MVATYKDIRRLTGLSLATISKYYNGGNVLGPNRELIESAAAALDYQVNDVARGLRSRRSMTVGVDPRRAPLHVQHDDRLPHRGAAARGGLRHDHLRLASGRRDAGRRHAVPRREDGRRHHRRPRRRRRRVPRRRPGPRRPGRRGRPSDARYGLGRDRQPRRDRFCRRSSSSTPGTPRSACSPDPTSRTTMRERRAGFVSTPSEARRVCSPAPSCVAADLVSVEGGYAGLRRLLGFSAPPTAVVCANYELHAGRDASRSRAGPATPTARRSWGSTTPSSRG